MQKNLLYTLRIQLFWVHKVTTNLKKFKAVVRERSETNICSLKSLLSLKFVVYARSLLKISICLFFSARIHQPHGGGGGDSSAGTVFKQNPACFHFFEKPETEIKRHAFNTQYTFCKTPE